MTICSLDELLSYLEPVCCSMSNSNCCFLICIQISQEADQVFWYSHLFQNFPQKPQMLPPLVSMDKFKLLCNLHLGLYHSKEQSHDSFKPFWTGLGACLALPRKPHYVSNKLFLILLMHMWHQLSWHLNQFWEGGLILPSARLP